MKTIFIHKKLAVLQTLDIHQQLMKPSRKENERSKTGCVFSKLARTEVYIGMIYHFVLTDVIYLLHHVWKASSLSGFQDHHIHSLL